jgi:integrase
MASVWKRPNSQFFTACFTDKHGQRRKRSTKMRDRRKAQALADEWEAVARGKKTLVQARRVLSDLTRDILGAELESLKLRDYVERWVASRKGEVAPATAAFYSGKSKSFLAFMAARGRDECALIEVQREDILAWRDAQGKDLAAKTVNHALKLLRMIFKQAKTDGYLADDPTEAVRILSTKGVQVARRSFTRDELEVVLRCCDAEWRSMVLFGYYTSHRLMDIASLRWRDLDIEQRAVRFVTRKTGTAVNVPMHEDLYEHILSLSTPDNALEPVHPRAAGVLQEDQRTPRLSNEFGAILAKAGLRSKDWRQTKDKGNRKRQGSELSFHSLRHTIITDLQAAGASVQIAGAIAGHSSAAMTRIYTHADSEAAREAMNKVQPVKRQRKTEQLNLFDEE